MKKILHLYLLTFCLFGSYTECANGQTTYTTNGTFDVNALCPGATSITIECWGAGGGGGNSTASNSSGGGGGGGYASRTISVTAGQIFTITVGTSTANTDGGESKVTLSGTDIVVAKGGKRGAVTAGGQGGCVAGDCTGDVIRNGGNGGNGRGSGTGGGGGGGGAGTTANGGNGNGSGSSGGAGGAGNPGGGANPGKGADGRTGSNGNNTNTANAYGGGGGGTRGAGNGSPGTSGFVRITCHYTVDDFTIEDVTATPGPLCLDQAGELTVEVTNNSGSNISAGPGDYKIDYSPDNITWTNNVTEVNSINDGATQNYSFNIPGFNTTGSKTIYIRIRKQSDGTIITSKTLSINVVNCNPSADPNCSNATLINTNSTYVGNTGNFPNVPGGGHWLDGAVAGSTIENIGYYQFVAGSTSLNFTVCQPNCGALSGIQIYIFKTCGVSGSKVLAVRQICPSCGSLSTSTGGGYTSSWTNNGSGCYTITLSGLTVGDTYYWGVDGFEGSNCDYSISFNNGIVLSVELISFTGFALQEGNHLKWQTATEINNDYFELQSTTDGMNFKAVGRIKGAGTSKEQHNYDFLDYTSEQITYYRLKQIDFDGNYSYHPIIPVDRAKSKEIAISPNPVTNILYVDLNVSVAGVYSFSFINTLGASVEKSFVLDKGNNRVEITVSGEFADGFYVLRIADNNGTVIGTNKFVKN